MINDCCWDTVKKELRLWQRVLCHDKVKEQWCTDESVFNWNTPNAFPISQIQHPQSLYRIYMPFQNPQSTVPILPYHLFNPKAQSRISHPIPVYSISPLPVNSPYSPQFSSRIQTLPSIPSSQTQTSILSESNHFSFSQRLNRSIS